MNQSADDEWGNLDNPRAGERDGHRESPAAVDEDY